MNARRGYSLTQRIVDDLGMSIVKGQYDDQDFPNEAQLCEHFQASRSVIREVVKILGAKGMVVSRPRIGTRIRPEEEWNILDAEILRWFLQRRLSIKLLREFFEVRKRIEPAAASLAAENATEAQLDTISRAFEAMEAAGEGQGDPLDADIAFHLAILEASGNRFYRQLSSLTETALRFSIRLTNRYRDDDQHMDLHRQVCTAICERKPEDARQHVEEMLSVVGRILETSADDPS